MERVGEGGILPPRDRYSLLNGREGRGEKVRKRTQARVIRGEAEEKEEERERKKEIRVVGYFREKS